MKYPIFIIAFTMLTCPNMLAAQSSTTTSSYPYNPDITTPSGDAGFETASKQRVNSIGQHTSIARVGAIVENVVDGSGVPSGPLTADYSFAVSALKSGYAGYSPTKGEMNGILISLRQDNGDSNLLSLNGQIVDRGSGNPNLSGYLSMMEGHSSVISSSSPFATLHDVDVQVGVADPRDNFYIGFYTMRVTGDGGVGIWADSSTANHWDYGLRLSKSGFNQLEQRTSDAALLLYPAGGGSAVSITNIGGQIAIGGNLQVAGAITQAGTWATFTPTVTPLTGAYGIPPVATYASGVDRLAGLR